MKTPTISVAPEREKETRSESKKDRKSKKAIISTKRIEDFWIGMDSIKKLKQAFGLRRRRKINFQEDPNGMSASLILGGSMAMGRVYSPNSASLCISSFSFVVQNLKRESERHLNGPTARAEIWSM